MSSRYLDMVRGQRRKPSGGFQFNSKTLLMILAVIAMCGSAAYWWNVQKQFTQDFGVAVAFTAIMVLAPPSLTSFLIPWSPGGMLLQKINARTWGHLVVVACSIILLFYSFQIQFAWWSSQPGMANSGIVQLQVLIGMIGFIVIPALMWAPVSSEDLVEQVRQAHLVKRYELQTQADIAILRATLLRAQEKALIGFANLTVEEREELASVMRSLVSGIDSTLREIGQSVKTVSGATVHFDALDDNEDIREVLNYISDSLVHTALVDGEQEYDDDVLPTAPGARRPARIEAAYDDDDDFRTIPQERSVTRPSRRSPNYYPDSER